MSPWGFLDHSVSFVDLVAHIHLFLLCHFDCKLTFHVVFYMQISYAHTLSMKSQDGAGKWLYWLVFIASYVITRLTGRGSLHERISWVQLAWEYVGAILWLLSNGGGLSVLWAVPPPGQLVQGSSQWAAFSLVTASSSHLEYSLLSPNDGRLPVSWTKPFPPPSCFWS